MATTPTPGTEQGSPDLASELARQAVDAFNERDVDALAALLHDDCEFFSAFGSIEGKVYRGPIQTKAYVGDIDATFDHWHLESLLIHPAPEGRAVCTYRAIGKAKGSGFPIDVPLALLWETRDGRLIRGEVHLDQAAALHRAGLVALARDWKPTPSAGD